MKPYILIKTLTEDSLKSLYEEFLYLERQWGVMGDRPWTHEKFFNSRPCKWELSSYAIADGRVAGYTIVSQTNDSESFLHKILIDKDYQGRGIGKALLEETSRKCRERGIQTLNFKVRTNNQKAIDFYEKLNTRFSDKVTSWDGVERYQCELKLV